MALIESLIAYYWAPFICNSHFHRRYMEDEQWSKISLNVFESFRMLTLFSPKLWVDHRPVVLPSSRADFLHQIFKSRIASPYVTSHLLHPIIAFATAFAMLPTKMHCLDFLAIFVVTKAWASIVRDFTVEVVRDIRFTLCLGQKEGEECFRLIVIDKGRFV